METKIKLNICGTDYYLTTDEDESYIRGIGEEVESQMNEILTSNPCASTTMAAVMCALYYADMRSKANDTADNLRNQIKEYLEDSQKSRLEADEAKREVERLRRELQGLRLRLAEIEDR